MASGSSPGRRRQAGQPDRPAAELVDDRQQQPAIDLVEAVLVDFEQLHRLVGDLAA